MDGDEDALRAFKNAVFNAGVTPGRGYVEFFADAMRWPVDAFASRTVSDDNRFEHHVAWLKGNAIGSASYVASDEPTLTASVHSLASVVRIELGAASIRTMASPRPSPGRCLCISPTPRRLLWISRRSRPGRNGSRPTCSSML